MAKKRKQTAKAAPDKAAGADKEAQLLDRIKRLAVSGMFSDDELMEQLVLKGGNALALVHQLNSRASIDLDFSIRHDFSEPLEQIEARISNALKKIFQENGFTAFDISMQLKPAVVTADLADFWGGYQVEFKLIDSRSYDEHSGDLDWLRKNAITIGQGKRFLIDISRFEYVEDKQPAEIDGYRIYAYSLLMIVCEKLRALCQQMDEYAEIVKRSRPGAPRARDLFDIYTIVSKLGLDLTSERALLMVREMFQIKHVPIDFLSRLRNYEDFHKTDYQAVIDTVHPGTQLESFDVYFDFVAELAERIAERL